MKSSAGPQKYNVNLIKFLNLITKKKVWQDTQKRKVSEVSDEKSTKQILGTWKDYKCSKKKKIELRFGNVLDQALNEVWNQENNRTKSED